MKSRRVLSSLAIGCAALATAAGAQSPQDLFDELVPPEVALAHAAELGLTADQRQAIERIQADAHPQSRTLVGRMRRERDALVALLRQEKPDEAAVVGQFEALNAVETDLKRLRLRLSTRTKRVLTAAQQAQALGLQRRRLGESGLQDKLRRVREGLERWRREGRDVAPLRTLWDRFREAEDRGFYRQARQALDEAVALLDAPPPRK